MPSGDDLARPKSIKNANGQHSEGWIVMWERSPTLNLYVDKQSANMIPTNFYSWWSKYFHDPLQFMLCSCIAAGRRYNPLTTAGMGVITCLSQRGSRWCACHGGAPRQPTCCNDGCESPTRRSVIASIKCRSARQSIAHICFDVKIKQTSKHGRMLHAHRLCHLVAIRDR